MKLYDPQMYWPQDIDSYVRLKSLVEKYPNSEVLKNLLERKRNSMIERYGKTAMKNI
jgi:predicted CopG family antitoxin